MAALCLCLTGTVAAPGTAAAAMLEFYCVTGNGVTDCTTGEAQMRVDVLAAPEGASFTFRNEGPAVSSIADVYFEATLFQSIVGVMNDPGRVAFSIGATPSNLPGANDASPPFRATERLSVDSDAPVQPMGVNPGEALTLYLSLRPGAGFDDVLGALADGSLRIGLHVQGFADGGSESFVNLPWQGPLPVPLPVPLPAGFVLLTSGLGFVVAATRRRQARSTYQA